MAAFKIADIHFFFHGKLDDGGDSNKVILRCRRLGWPAKDSLALIAKKHAVSIGRFYLFKIWMPTVLAFQLWNVPDCDLCLTSMPHIEPPVLQSVKIHGNLLEGELSNMVI